MMPGSTPISFAKEKLTGPIQGDRIGKRKREAIPSSFCCRQVFD
jgi:hypothetical protein